MNNPFIVAEQVFKYFNEGLDTPFCALKDISFQVQRGTAVWLKGASGSGKTTLLSILACLDRPSAGRIMLDGQVLSQANETFLAHFRRQHIGIVFQNYNLLMGATVSENIAVPLMNSDRTTRRINLEVQAAAEKAQIAHKIQQNVSKLSGGEQQRVALARALVHKPSLILADEPTAHLDKANGLMILDLFQSIVNEGNTLIFTSHDQRILESNLQIHQTLELNDGRLVTHEATL